MGTHVRDKGPRPAAKVFRPERHLINGLFGCKMRAYLAYDIYVGTYNSPRGSISSSVLMRNTSPGPNTS